MTLPLPKPYQHKNYFFNLLIALDELGNTIIGGSPHETMSAHAYRAQYDGSAIGNICVHVINFIFAPFQKDHCYQAYIQAMARATLTTGLA